MKDWLALLVWGRLWGRGCRRRASGCVATTRRFVASLLCIVAPCGAGSRVGDISMCISRSKVLRSSHGASIGAGMRSCLMRWMMRLVSGGRGPPSSARATSSML
eukprot:8139372-Pyramimonas_sp.AAC.1